MEELKAKPSRGWWAFVPLWFWIVLAGAAFAAAAGFIAFSRPRADRPEIGFAVDVQHALGEQLRDYPSARFAQVRFAFPPNGHRLACGRINAKNAFGEYAGWRSFAANQAPGQRLTVTFEGPCDAAPWLPTDYTALLQPQ